MQSQPFIKFSYEIDIHASPEVIFPYLVDPEKITIWHSFEYLGQTSSKTTVEYKGTPNVGTEFTSHIKIDPIPGANTQAIKQSHNINGIITQYNPPSLLEIKSSVGKKSSFKTVTYDLYTLTNIDGGTRLRLDSKMCLEYEGAENITNIMLRLLQLLITRSVYISYLVIKKFFAIMFYFQLKGAMKIPFKKLKQNIDKIHSY